MNVKLLFTLTLMCLLTSNSLLAQNKPYRVGTTTANFLEIGIGSAGKAMGDAYTSVTRDVTSIYWNPSGLAFLDHNDVLFYYQPWIAEIDLAFAGVAIPVPSIGTFGISLTSMNYGRIPVTTMTMQEGTGETYEAKELAVSLAYARSIVDWFAFGAAVKYVSSSIWHMTGSATALDLGVLISTDFLSVTGERNHGLAIGMSISNYGSRLTYDGIDILRPIDILPDESGNYKDIEGQYRLQGWELPLIFRVGISVTPVMSERQQLILAVDALHPNNNSESLNMGAEYQYKLLGFGKFYLRGGYRGLYMDESIYGFSAGAGLYINILNDNVLRLDYSYEDVGILGDAVTYSLGFMF